MASESGVVDIEPENVEFRGRLQPGRIFVADLEQGRIISDQHTLTANGAPQASQFGELPALNWHTYGSGHLHGLSAPGLELEIAQIGRAHV